MTLWSDITHCQLYTIKITVFTVFARLALSLSSVKNVPNLRGPLDEARPLCFKQKTDNRQCPTK